VQDINIMITTFNHCNWT